MDLNLDLDFNKNNGIVERNFKNSFIGRMGENLVEQFLISNRTNNDLFNYNLDYLDNFFFKGNQMFSKFVKNIDDYRDYLIDKYLYFGIKNEELDFYVSQKFLSKFDFIAFDYNLNKIIILEVKTKIKGLNKNKFGFNKPSLDLYKKLLNDDRFIIKFCIVEVQDNFNINMKFLDFREFDNKIVSLNSEYCKKLKNTQNKRNGISR